MPGYSIMETSKVGSFMVLPFGLKQPCTPQPRVTWFPPPPRTLACARVPRSAPCGAPSKLRVGVLLPSVDQGASRNRPLNRSALLTPLLARRGLYGAPELPCRCRPQRVERLT